MLMAPFRPPGRLTRSHSVRRLAPSRLSGFDRDPRWRLQQGLALMWMPVGGQAENSFNARLFDLLIM